MTTLTDYLIKLSEDKEENKKYTDDQEAALAGSGLSEEHKALLREDNRSRENIRAAILEETPGAQLMASFMTSHTVSYPGKGWPKDEEGMDPNPPPPTPPSPPPQPDNPPKRSLWGFWRRR